MCETEVQSSQNMDPVTALCVDSLKINAVPSRPQSYVPFPYSYL